VRGRYALLCHQARRRQTGFDHGVGHPLLFLCDANVPNYRKNKRLKDLGHYSEWPKVADAVIKARKLLKRASFASVEELQAKVLAFIEYCNATMAKPFKWMYGRQPLSV
jgi:hypothetical protein